MKKRIFYNIGIKYLVVCILIAVTTLTAVVGGWIVMGLNLGLTPGELAKSIPLESSQTAINHLENSAYEIINHRKGLEKYSMDGMTYDETATIDISDPDAGVTKKNKNPKLEYRLGDLKDFYVSDGYAILQHITYNGDIYVQESQPEQEAIPEEYYEDAAYADDPEEFDEEAPSTEEPGDEVVAAENPAATRTDVRGPAEPLSTRTEELDWYNGESTDYITYDFKVYSNLYNVLYNNGIEVEKKYIPSTAGTTIAAYAQKNLEDVSIRDMYTNLLTVSQEVYDFTNAVTETNALVYVRDTETGEVYTNVTDWQHLTLMDALNNYSEQHIFEDSEVHALYYLYDESTEDSEMAEGTSSKVSLMNAGRDIRDKWETDTASKHYQMLLALDTNYPVKDWMKTRSETVSWYYQTRPLGISPFAVFGNPFVWLIAGLVVMIFLLILVSCQTGHKPEDDKIHLAPLDYFPIELLMAADVILWILVIAGFVEALVSGVSSGALDVYELQSVYGHGGYPFGCVMFVLGTALFAWDLKHYGRRIKAKKLGGSIIRVVGKGIKKAGNAVGDSIRSAYRARKEHQKLLLIYISFVILHFVFLGFAGLMLVHGEPVIILILVVLLIVFDVFVLVRLVKTTVGRDEVKKGMDAIAAGNLDYRINVDGMSGSNKEMAEQINNMRDSLQQAVETEMKSERLKTDLITNVSHDIKTPLTSIINYVDILKRENIEDEKIAGYIDVLDRKSLRLKQLTEDLVEASKISSGNITLEMQDINLKQLIKQTNGEFEEKFAAKNLELICSLPESEMLIRADGRRMFRVIENLYNNTAKYSMPNSRVYVTGEIKGGKVIFSMKNMSESPLNIKADELLERFVRGDVSRSTEGSGLGLEIARNLTVMQEGTFDLYLDGDLFKVTITFDAI